MSKIGDASMCAQPAPMLSALMASLAPSSGPLARNMPTPSAARAVIAIRSQLRSRLWHVLDSTPGAGWGSAACCCGRNGSRCSGDRGESIGGLAPLHVRFPCQVSILDHAVVRAADSSEGKQRCNSAIRRPPFPAYSRCMIGSYGRMTSLGNFTTHLSSFSVLRPVSRMPWPPCSAGRSGCVRAAA